MNAPVLYVEDDENDAFLLRRAFKQADIPHNLVVVEDGNAAVDYLAGAGPYQDREQHPLPCLVLLDLNMPGRSGFEVLEWLRARPDLSALPTVILTSSPQELDVHSAYTKWANGFLVKPNTPDELLTVAKAIRDFWLRLNRAPCLGNRQSSQPQVNGKQTTAQR
jgi:CheY-like chemotaxis protein